MSIEEMSKGIDAKIGKPVPGEKPDTPGVIVFPPLLFLGAIILGVALQILWPIHLWPATPARFVGALLLCAGAALAITAFKSFRRAGTNVRPDQPTTAIANDGPYRLTRNPIYLGNTLVYIGLALLFNAFW